MFNGHKSLNEVIMTSYYFYHTETKRIPHGTCSSFVLVTKLKISFVHSCEPKKTSICKIDSVWSLVSVWHIQLKQVRCLIPEYYMKGFAL